MEKIIRLRVSSFVLTSEVGCKCPVCRLAGPFMPDPGVVSLFDRWRALVGHALPITSFVRCAAHNEKIGGAHDSLHLVAAAIDFHDPTSEITPDYLDRLDQFVGPGGLGIYNIEGHFHIDVGHLLGLPAGRRWRGVLK